MPADYLDQFGRAPTVFHGWPARLKILLVLIVIGVSLLIEAEAWPAYGCLLAVLFAAHALAGIPVRYAARRLGLILPFVALMALAAPASHGFARGWDLAAAIIARSTLALAAGLWLVSTTPFEELTRGMCGLGMPRGFATMLAFMYRYAAVLFDELARMRTAQRARTLARRGFWRVWKDSGQLLGVLVVRSMCRAERIHAAMLARGWAENGRRRGPSGVPLNLSRGRPGG
jgi:cobalt/nickel transport system permease protein